MAKVSKREAQAVLKAVAAKYADHISSYGSEPKVYEPGFHARGWTVAWDGGPEEWPFQDYGVPGVWTEPINHWSIAVYPNE